MCAGDTWNKDVLLVPLSKSSAFLINLFSFLLFCALFEQEGMSEERELISAFLQSLTDDSTTTDDAMGWTNKPIQMLLDPMSRCLQFK